MENPMPFDHEVGGADREDEEDDLRMDKDLSDPSSGGGMLKNSKSNADVRNFATSTHFGGQD